MFTHQICSGKWTITSNCYTQHEGIWLFVRLRGCKLHSTYNKVLCVLGKLRRSSDFKHIWWKDTRSQHCLLTSISYQSKLASRSCFFVVPNVAKRVLFSMFKFNWGKKKKKKHLWLNKHVCIFSIFHCLIPRRVTQNSSSQWARVGFTRDSLAVQSPVGLIIHILLLYFIISLRWFWGDSEVTQGSGGCTR